MGGPTRWATGVLSSVTLAVPAKWPPPLAQQDWDFTQNTRFCLQHPQPLLHPSLPMSWCGGDVPPPGSPRGVSAAFPCCRQLHLENHLSPFSVGAKHFLPPCPDPNTQLSHPCIPLSPLPPPAHHRLELGTI